MDNHRTEPIKVVGYIRTSTGDGKQEDSPEVQESKLRDACERKGWTLLRVYTDYLPGKTPLIKRPQFSKMLTDINRLGFDGIVCIATDRAFRLANIKHTVEQLVDTYDIFIYGFDDVVRYGRVPGMSGRIRAAEKMQSNMQAMVNQYYSDFISDKVTDKQEYRVHKQRLHSGGPPPFGYCLHLDVAHPDLGKHLNLWGPDEAWYGAPDGRHGRRQGVEWLRWIFTRFLETENMHLIATELNEAQVPTPRLIQWNRLSHVEQERRLAAQARRRESGLKTMHLPPLPWWDSSVLSDILRSPVYLGQVSYTPSCEKQKGQLKSKRWHPGLHPAIVDLDAFNAVQQILGKRTRRQSPGRKHEVLLSGLLRCCCGLGQMTRAGRHDDPSDFNYACGYNKKTGGKACGNPRKGGIAVHRAAFRLLQMGLMAKREQLIKNPLLPKARNHRLNEALQAKQAERDTVIEMGIRQILSLEEVTKRLQPLDADLADLRRAVAADADPDTSIEEIDALILNLEENWHLLDFQIQRELFRAYVPEGFVLDHGYLRAKVCGMLLGVTVEKLPSIRKDSLAGHYSTHEAAKRLGVTPQTVVNMVKRGTLPVVQVQTGKLEKQYIPREAIDSLSKKQSAD